ncbi:MAG: 2-amino-4-hydroxy-6-hydroxymethyldihydropteridine diphosphokinase [Ignavibacteriae bacterium]|nr:2-amino-4-hydroxy-6-hydroxymethyldihydropteridine diphosphokinase [Ignavibacteriota bacterium]
MKKVNLNKVYLGLGSNVGDRKENFRKVISSFNKNKSISHLRIASIYETKPYGGIEQENFLNTVVYFETCFAPEEIFELTKNLENEIGRIKRKNWGPREIDIDILLFNDLVYKDEKLSIPHKDLLNRDFVLIPLLELNENLIYPKEKKEIKQFLYKLTDQYIVKKIRMVFN